MTGAYRWRHAVPNRSWQRHLQGSDHRPGLSGTGNDGVLDLDAVTRAHCRKVAPDRDVLGGAIVPEGDRVLAPTKPRGILWLADLRVEIVQDRATFVATDAVDVAGVFGIDEQQLAARLGMAADDRLPDSP